MLYSPMITATQKHTVATQRLRIEFKLHCMTLWRRKWKPTPMFLPGGEQRSLMGCCPWGRTELNTTEAT